jgi:DNA-binding transcriptional MerR regulator
MFKNFLLKKMLRSQGVPPEQIDMLLKMMEKDPALFKKIAEEIKAKMDSGVDQMTAGMQVMEKYKEELKKLA